MASTSTTRTSAVVPVTSDNHPINETISVNYLLKGLEEESINLSPMHQRGLVHSRAWQEGIVGSIFVIKMIPPVYFHTVYDNTRHMYVDENIDGKQRLTAITQYCNNEYKYTLSDVPELHNKYFNQLTDKQQQTIKSFKVYVIKYPSPLSKEQIEYLFSRFNNTKPTKIGEKLNACLDSVAYPFIKPLVETGALDVIQQCNTRNQHMEAASRMAYMIRERTLKGLSNEALYEWFHNVPYTQADVERLSTYVEAVSELMTVLDVKNKNAKGHYLSILWFLLNHDSDELDLLRRKGANGRFTFPPSGNNSDHDPAKRKYGALCAFLEEHKQPPVVPHTTTVAGVKRSRTTTLN